MDLSELYFYVGIKDDETGIFVSGSDITEDTTLEVEIKEHKGGHKFKVFFDVPWAKDGELVRICHMKHDGTIQIEEVPAKMVKCIWRSQNFLHS